MCDFKSLKNECVKMSVIEEVFRGGLRIICGQSRKDWRWGLGPRKGRVSRYGMRPKHSEGRGLHTTDTPLSVTMLAGV